MMYSLKLPVDYPFGTLKYYLLSSEVAEVDKKWILFLSRKDCLKFLVPIWPWVRINIPISFPYSHPMSRNHKQPIFLEKNQFQKRKKILKELWHSICQGKYKIAVKKSEFIAKGH